MIKVITNESDDWVIVKLDGKTIHEGHSISNTDFCCILRELGIDVREKTISDVQMEEGVY